MESQHPFAYLITSSFRESNSSLVMVSLLKGPEQGIQKHPRRRHLRMPRYGELKKTSTRSPPTGEKAPRLGLDYQIVFAPSLQNEYPRHAISAKTLASSSYSPGSSPESLA